jgi:hypothetical protein
MDFMAQAPVSGCFTNAGFAAGTTSTISTTATAQYALRGKAYSKTAVTNGATPTTDATTGAAFVALSANQGTVVYLGFDSSGNQKAAQGSIVALDSSGAFIVAPQPPSIDDSVWVPVGYVVLKAGSTLSGTWTFGTNNLSSVTGMTYTFVSVMGPPGRPQVS